LIQSKIIVIQIRRGGREARLGPAEFRLLDGLMQHPDRMFNREQVLDIVWGSDAYVEARTLDVDIGWLRKALNPAAQDDPHGALGRLFPGPRRPDRSRASRPFSAEVDAGSAKKMVSF
jgi:hypothetical protein